MPSEIAHQIEKIRRCQPDLTQEAIANALGVNQSSVSRWEKGAEPAQVDRARILDGLRHLENAPPRVAVAVARGMEPEVSARAARALKRLVRDIRNLDREAAELGACFSVLIDMLNLPSSADPERSHQRLVSGLERRIKKAKQRPHLSSIAAFLKRRLDQIKDGSPC